MIDLSKKTIEDLCYQQIRRMTLGNKDSLSYQFSDGWVRG